MRKLVILALILTFAAFSFAVDCPAGQVKGDADACLSCTDTKVDGIANCGTCTFDATSKKVKCTACANDYFFATLAKTACSKCEACQAGGQCVDAAAEPAGPVECKACGDGFLLVEKACKACAAGCKGCEKDASVTDSDKTCTSCLKGFFHSAEAKTCTGCDASCGDCSAAAVCTQCKTAGNLLNRPVDDGKCVAADACVAPKAIGSSSKDVKLCSQYNTPVVVKLNATSFVLNSTHNNQLNLGNLCGPASDVQATKDAELVGAVVASTVGDKGQDAIDIYTVRDAIKAAVGAEAYGKGNSGGVVGGVNWLNIVGTAAGTAALSGFRVPKGLSTLNYVCVNTLNVVSALQTVKINNNVTLNPSVRFAVSFKRVLNGTELNNLTCNIAKAIFPDSAELQGKVVNSADGKACVATPAASRILQAATGYGDYYFEVPASQFDDSLEATVKGKLTAVKTAVTAFSTAVNAPIASEPAAISATPGVTYGVPTVVVSLTDKNASTVSYSINSTESANVWVAVVASGQANVNDEVLRGAQSNLTFFRENFALEAKAQSNRTVKNLSASTSYDLYYYAANSFDASKNTKIQKVVISTGSSFSSILAIGSFILIVLALFF